MVAEIGPESLLVILAIVAVLVGAKRLPELAHSLGRSKREFERGLRGEAPPRPPAGQSEGQASR